MDCFIYYESTVFIVYTSVVCAFTIIDLMCEMHGNREASVYISYTQEYNGLLHLLGIHSVHERCLFLYNI